MAVFGTDAVPSILPVKVSIVQIYRIAAVQNYISTVENMTSVPSDLFQ